MDLEGYKAGSPAALKEVVDRYGPWVWALSRRGFICQEALTLGSARGLVWVLGVPTPDVAADLTEKVLCEVTQPRARAEVAGSEDLGVRVLDAARRLLFRAGEKSARLISIGDPDARSAVPGEVEDLDALIRARRAPSLEAFTVPESEQKRLAQLSEAPVRVLADMDPRSLDLIRLRFVEDRAIAEIAKTFDCGTAAVATREARALRTVRRALETALDGRRVGRAEAEAVLSGHPDRLLPPPATWERVRRGVLTRTFQEEPAPFAQRLRRGVGFAAVAGLMWAAMLTGLLPSVEEDGFPVPRVELRCAPACLAGAEGHISVLSPQDAKRFSIWLRPSDSTAVRPLLVGPGGGTLKLPLGARDRLVAVPYPVRLPPDLPARSAVVAVFSDRPLSADRLLDFASGHSSQAGVLTTTVAIR